MLYVMSQLVLVVVYRSLVCFNMMSFFVVVVVVVVFFKQKTAYEI